MIERKVQRYGWRRDQPDPRDRLYNLEDRIEQGHALPPSATLRAEMPAVYDQMNLGSCTANADACLFEHQARLQGEFAATASRLFIYYEERRLEGNPPDQDTGAEVRTGIKVLATEGVPPEREWPYSDLQPGPFSQRPPASAFAHALKHEAIVYKRIVIGSPGAPMRTAIFNHQPIAFGFPVPQMFEDPSWDPANEFLPLPDQSTQYIGGHAVTVIGYDFSLRRFKVPVFEIRNSWGPDWGDSGHFWCDARWFDVWRNLAADLWVVSRVS